MRRISVKVPEKSESDHIRLCHHVDDDTEKPNVVELQIYCLDEDYDIHSLERRSNQFMKHLVEMKEFQKEAQHINHVSLSGLCLDDWDPLLKSLQQSRFGAEKNLIEQLDFSNCYFTERGSLLLVDILETTPPLALTNNCEDKKNLPAAVTTTTRTNGILNRVFSIKSLMKKKKNKGNKKNNNNEDKNQDNPSSPTTRTARNEIFAIKSFSVDSAKGSRSWVNGLARNKTITHLYLSYMPVLCSAIRFIENSPQLKESEIRELTSEHKEEIVLDFGNTNHASCCPRELNLETFAIVFPDFDEDEEELYPLTICQSIGSILRRSNKLKDLTLDSFKRDFPYNILKDTIHCEKLSLFWSDFDPTTLASLVVKDDSCDDGGRGKLKQFHFYHVNDSNLERLLQLFDLSLLDSLEIDCNGLVKTLADRLVKNMGPKKLTLMMNDVDLNSVASTLASGLVGNDKIENLEIRTEQMVEGSDLDPQRELVDTMMSQMPRLQSWKVGAFYRVNDEFTNKQWHDWILHHLETNHWNIQEIEPPSYTLRDDVEAMLLFNKYWRSLLSCNETMPCGVWSLALGRIETVGLMFNVLQQVPSLFRDAADEREACRRSPSFVIPHHVNCPGCRCKLVR